MAVALLLVAGCGGWLADSDIDVLAKTDPPFHPETEPNPVVGPAMEPGLRVAVDAHTARKLWDALEVDELEPASDPAERGRHGALDAVDFDEQVVVLWRGESGTCPERVDDVATATDGTVEVRLSQRLSDGGCTSDYQPYAVLAAVDRTQMPAALPARGRAVGPGDDHTEELAVVDAAAPDRLADAPAAAMAALPPPQRRGRETLVAHPAWTVRDAGMLARPGDAFELADGLSEVELVRTDRRGQPVGEPRRLAADTGELPDAEEATYRLTGRLDGQPAREWIRVPAIDRSASLRINARHADDEDGSRGSARAGEPLKVRVVNDGTVALGYRAEVAWQPWEPDEAEAPSPAPTQDFVEEGLVEPAPSQQPPADTGSAADGSSGQPAQDTDPATPADDRPVSEGAVRRVDPGGESEPIPNLRARRAGHLPARGPRRRRAAHRRRRPHDPGHLRTPLRGRLSSPMSTLVGPGGLGSGGLAVASVATRAPPRNATMHSDAENGGWASPLCPMRRATPTISPAGIADARRSSRAGASDMSRLSIATRWPSTPATVLWGDGDPPCARLAPLSGSRRSLRPIQPDRPGGNSQATVTGSDRSGTVIRIATGPRRG